MSFTLVSSTVCSSFTMLRTRVRSWPGHPPNFHPAMADSEGATAWFDRVQLAIPGSSTLTTSDTTFGDTLGAFSQPATQDLYDDDASQTTFEDALTHISDSTVPRISIESIDHLDSADPESAAQNDNNNPQPDTISPAPLSPQIRQPIQHRIIPVNLPLTPIERLKTLNIRSSVHLSADESPEFSRQENDALEQFIYIISSDWLNVFRAHRFPMFIPCLVSVTDNQSNPPKSLGTYICIKGLLREKQLRIFHNAVSRRDVRRYFAPLRVCYDTRLIRYAASEETSEEPALPKQVETNCGQLLRTRREDGSEYLTTIGGLVTFGNQCYIMTSSDHHQASSDTDSTDTDSVDSDTTDEDSGNEWESASPVTAFGDEDYDGDIEPPLILGLKDDGHQPESVPGTNKLGGMPPAPHVSGILEVDSPGILGQDSNNSHWRLTPVPSGRFIPNRISIPTEIFGAPVISGNINGHRECDGLGPGTSVAINAGVSGITAGKVTGKPSYLVTNGRLQRVWTIALPPDTNLQRGDSGSWILDQSLSVLGSVLAISDGYVYMVSINEQLAQIEEVLRRSLQADSVLHTKAEIPYMTTFLRCLAAMHTDSEENSTKNGPQTDSGVSFCSGDRLQFWEAPQTDLIEDEANSGVGSVDCPADPQPLSREDVSVSESQEHSQTPIGSSNLVTHRQRLLGSLTGEEQPPSNVDTGPPESGISQRDILSLHAAASGNRDDHYILEPTGIQMLGPFSTMCLILNRTIGSGIFTHPTNVLEFTGGSTIIALVLWVVGGLIAVSSTVVWIESGLSIPKSHVQLYSSRSENPSKISVLGTGGGFSKLNFIRARLKPFFAIVSRLPPLLTLWGSLAGNALQFGLRVGDLTCPPGHDCFNATTAVPWAIGVVVTCSIMSIGLSRRTGIWLNNAFAMVKVAVLLAIVAAPLIGYRQDIDRERTVSPHKKPVPEPSSTSPDIGSILTGLSFAIFAYSGGGLDEALFETQDVQPRRKKLATPALVGIGLLVVLYPLVNMAFYGTASPGLTTNVVLTFFEEILVTAGGNPDIAKVIIAFLVAFSTLGNIFAITWTQSIRRVGLQKEGLFVNVKHGFLSFLGIGLEKQEILKESLIPFALEDSSPRQSRFLSNVGSTKVDMELHMFGFLMALHVTYSLDPTTSYNFLTFMVAYTSTTLPGICVVGCVLYLKATPWLRHQGWAGFQFLTHPINQLFSWHSRQSAPLRPKQGPDGSNNRPTVSEGCRSGICQCEECHDVEPGVVRVGQSHGPAAGIPLFTSISSVILSAGLCSLLISSRDFFQVEPELESELFSLFHCGLVLLLFGLSFQLGLLVYVLKMWYETWKEQKTLKQEERDYQKDHDGFWRRVQERAHEVQ